MNKLPQTLTLCCVAMFAGMAFGQPGNPPFGPFAGIGDNRLDTADDLAELIVFHQEDDVARGDFESNGNVGFSDFLILSNNFKAEVDFYSEGDANLDGVVDLEDFAIQSTNFGKSGFAPDPPPVERVHLTWSIDDMQRVVITPEETVRLGGLVIQSIDGDLADIAPGVSARPFDFFLERTNKSATLASLGNFFSARGSFTTNVIADPEAELSLQWFQRGSYEVFSTEDIVPEPDPMPGVLVGDIDQDGIVAFADFLILSNSYGQEVSPNTEGDLDGDGNVAFADFLLLSDNFGVTAATSVPESSTGISALLGLLSVICMRRRRETHEQPVNTRKRCLKPVPEVGRVRMSE